ncbi:MAG: HAD hydrolase family protein [Spirochaetota bacterium]
MFRTLRYYLIKRRLSRIRLIVSDVDGVLTDGRIVVTDKGYEQKNYHSRDGFAIRLGREMGLSFAVLTARDTEAVRIRFKKQLKLTHVITGAADKGKAMEAILRDFHVTREETAYIGDEFIDLTAMAYAGVAFAPSDAAREVRHAADWVTHVPGGEGVLRETVMLILRAQGRSHEALRRYR